MSPCWVGLLSQPILGGHSYRVTKGTFSWSSDKGFDAVDTKGRCVQIKTRRSESDDLPKDGGRLSKFSVHECDYALLGILNSEYKLVAVWKADFSKLKPIILKHKRANPTIRQFKSIGVQVYP